MGTNGPTIRPNSAEEPNVAVCVPPLACMDARPRRVGSRRHTLRTVDRIRIWAGRAFHPGPLTAGSRVLPDIVKQNETAAGIATAAPGHPKVAARVRPGGSSDTPS